MESLLPGDEEDAVDVDIEVDTEESWGRLAREISWILAELLWGLVACKYQMAPTIAITTTISKLFLIF
jgi:hypothetical protein